VTFQVDWLQIALDELTDLWTRADSIQRQAITAASPLLEQRLKIDPANEGESRPGGRRITFVPPLAVRFQIEADGQTVTVLHVRLFGRRKK
jgi:hypothetical protein